MKKVIIIGMPGCGKTQIGMKAASDLGLSFTDVDLLIEDTHGPIPGIFENEGEEKFRMYETEALKRAVAGEWTVISAGGGIIEKERNRRILCEHHVIFIDRKPEDITDTLEAAGRPLLKDKPGALQRLYKRRYPIYLETMDYHVHNDGTEAECIGRVSKIISSLYGNRGGETL